MLEALVHPGASFLTLTYAPEKLPEGGTLVPRDLVLFLKRLRKAVEPHTLRYFAVGEYGDTSWRPHYHLALFGLDRSFALSIDKAWGLGFTYVGDLTFDSAQYVAGYVTKKMTDKDDDRLAGRYPEFARMSLRPGIGALSIGQVASALQNREGWRELFIHGDVPSVLSHNGRTLPLGRYLRQKLREELDIKPLGWSGGSHDNGAETFKKSAEMLVMYQNYIIDPKARAKGSFAELQQRIKAQKNLNQTTKAKIYGSKRKSGL